MAEEDKTELCTNCQRNIPAANYTIHSVHCIRNIRICQFCKEPVPVADMIKHTARVSCPMCSAVMQACDLGAHRSDACAHTSVQCQYCELLLARQLMAEHELYCGARTERCPACEELVMIKYRKLHEESNHGFIKLDDEPGPPASWIGPPAASRPQQPQRAWPSFSTGISSHIRHLASDDWHPDTYLSRPNHSSPFTNAERKFIVDAFAASRDNPSRYVRVKERHLPTPRDFDRSAGGGHLPAKRTNDMPQVNSTFGVASGSSGDKEPSKQQLSRPSASRGAIKKYQAPQPPGPSKKQKEPQSPSNSQPSSPSSSTQAEPSSPEPYDRNIPMYKAMMREQAQAKERADKTAYNLAHNLPPVLSAAEKLEKLRKMSALQNNDFEEDLRAKVKATKAKAANKHNGEANCAFTPMSNEELAKRLENKNKKKQKNKEEDGKNLNSNVRSSGGGAAANDVDLYNMHQYESVDYSGWSGPGGSRGDVANSEPREARVAEPFDRFVEIRKSLSVLRKGLDECTSPLEAKRSVDNKNMAVVPPVKNSNEANMRLNLQSPTSANLPPPRNSSPSTQSNMEWSLPSPVKDAQRSKESLGSVMLPCEFCRKMVAANQLVEHESRCILDPTMDTTYSNAVGITAMPEEADNSPEGLIFKRIRNQYLETKRADLQKPLPKTNNDSIEANNGLSNVMLPCEFCQSMIPAEYFVNHETGCNPLITSIQLPSSRSSTVTSANTAAPPNTPDSQPPPKHTNLDRQPRNRPDNERDLPDNQNPNIPDPRRARLARTMQQNENIQSPDDSRIVNSDSNEAIGSSDEIMLPCEFCMSLIPAAQLMIHQEACYNE